MLSVFLITRNEEASLALTLRSIEPVADELVVVDTGSTDRTIEIARDASAMIFDFPWADDFSAARNFAVGKTSGDWLLCMDADEEMLPGSYEVLRRAMGRADALGYTVRWQNLVYSDRPDYFTEMHPLRLLRRLEYVHFVGRIHEHLDPPIDQIMRREGKRIYPSQIILRHTGYVQEKKRDKLERSAHLLKLELQERPGQLYHLIEYGRTLLQLGDGGGHAALAEAGKRVWEMRDQPKPPMPLVAALLEYCLSARDVPAGNPITPTAARHLARRWFADSPPLLWLIAQHDFSTGDFAGAAALLERLVQAGKTGRYDCELSFDPRILGEDALLNLGACYLRLAQLDRAEACFRQLLGVPSRAEQARQNLEIIGRLREVGGD